MSATRAPRSRLPRALLAAATVLASLAADAAAATVAGRVLLPSPAAPERMPERYRAMSPNVAMEAPDPPAAVVYLEAAAAGAAAEPERAASSDVAPKAVAQQGLQFRPGLLAVRTGETIEFPNRDDTYHSVFSYSKAKRFDLGRYRKGEDPASVVFDKPGVVKLFCEIHEHMRATVLVLDTPYFAKTDGDGSFRIEGVVPGRYRLTAWVEEERALVREIDVADQESGALEIDAR